MKSALWPRHFSLALGLLLLSSPGCQTMGNKKESSTLRFHRAVQQNSGGQIITATVFRETPFEIHVESAPFLSERDIRAASVVDDLESFAIKIEFNRHGTLVLDTVTTEGKDRRIAIYSQFGEARWLGAPVYYQQISNGILFFTPDASRAESERIVRGLNNMAKKLKTKNF